MRSSFVVSLLLLCLFLTKAQGIRLEKGSLAVRQQKQHDEENNLLKRNDSDHDEEAILCKDEQCTGKIKSRKLVSTSVSTTHAISKHMENEGNEAHPPANGNTRNVKVNNGEEKDIKVNYTLAASRQQELSHEHYPDLVDITEMDYSPARREPPIHN